jgi:hypothetical protein
VEPKWKPGGGPETRWSPGGGQVEVRKPGGVQVEARWRLGGAQVEARWSSGFLHDCKYASMRVCKYTRILAWGNLLLIMCICGYLCVFGSVCVFYKRDLRICSDFLGRGSKLVISSHKYHGAISSQSCVFVGICAYLGVFVYFTNAISGFFLIFFGFPGSL